MIITKIQNRIVQLDISIFQAMKKMDEEKIKIKNPRMTIYNLTKEYEITKQGLRRWKRVG